MRFRGANGKMVNVTAAQWEAYKLVDVELHSKIDKNKRQRALEKYIGRKREKNYQAALFQQYRMGDIDRDAYDSMGGNRL